MELLRVGICPRYIVYVAMVVLWLLVVVVALATSGCSQPAPRSTPSPVSAQPPRPAAAGGPRLYVTNVRSGDLSVIDVGTREVVTTVPLGKRPRGVRVSPDGTVLFVALSGSPFAPPGVDEKTLPPPDRSADGIGVVDVRALRLVTVIPVGTLIEIEAPARRWFTARGKQSDDVTRALDQVNEWRAWLDVPENVQAFKSFYSLPDLIFTKRGLKPFFILILGRRDEATRTESLARKRAQLENGDLFVMSYDRLVPQAHAEQFMCVRVGKDAFRAVSVPPTLRLGPLCATSRAKIQDQESAVAANFYLDQERKDFLIRRIPYWDEWTHRRGIAKLADSE